MMLSALLTAALVLTALAKQEGLTVHTKQGDVVGSLISKSVRQFLGIPYATAKRWEAPQLPPNHSSHFKANKYGDSCPQATTPLITSIVNITGLVDRKITESEDCLSVNIWAPNIQRKQRTAVMIWIYGGGFVVGTSDSVVYDGRHIVRDHDDVVVVTFNYRVNIFGQPGAPQLAGTDHTQNFGLLDIDAAVKWVHDNIAAFGGDPERIILFGQSAGGIAIDAYTYVHPHDTIVKGLIQQSGNLLVGTFVTNNNGTLDPTPWNQVAGAVGCGTSNDAAQMLCMKAVSSKKLEDAVISTNSAFRLQTDNIRIPSNLTERAAAGDFLHVPLLGGSVEDEADLLVVPRELTTLGFSLPVVTEILSDLQTQLFFTCPAAKTASDRLKAGVPTWRYQYQAVFRDLSPRPDLRAYHASEISLVFGTFKERDGPSAPKPTVTEIALSKYIQGAWVAFARDPLHGLLGYGWPLYDPNTTSLVQVGNFFNETGATLGQARLLDFTCSSQNTLFAVMGQVSGLLAAASSLHS